MLYKVVTSFILIFSIISSSQSVFAQGKAPSSTPGLSATRPAAKEKPVQGRLQSCEARVKTLQKRSGQLVRLVENMLKKFNAIAERVKEYYTTKVLPSGKIVPNYESLLIEIDTKKIAVETALEKAQDDLEGFSCEEGNVKTHMQLFRENMQIVKQALKEYRNAIRNLIVAVHSLNEEPSPTTGGI